MNEAPISLEPIAETPKTGWRVWLAAGGCLLILCGMAFVGALIVGGPKLIQRFAPQKIQVTEGSARAVTQNNTMGNPEAPVHIIEYGDFQCPFCLKFWTESEPQLIDEYVNTNKVFFEFRAYPILGEESGWAAEAAYCAGDQGKFWEYHDTLFSNWTGENVGDFTKDKLVIYAQSLALNMDDFKACINQENHKVTVEQDKAQGIADGVQATPTFFINGVKVEGAQPYSVLKKYIEQTLDGNLEIQSG